MGRPLHVRRNEIPPKALREVYARMSSVSAPASLYSQSGPVLQKVKNTKSNGYEIVHHGCSHANGSFLKNKREKHVGSTINTKQFMEQTKASTPSRDYHPWFSEAEVVDNVGDTERHT